MAGLESLRLRVSGERIIHEDFEFAIRSEQMITTVAAQGIGAVEFATILEKSAPLRR